MKKEEKLVYEVVKRVKHIEWRKTAEGYSGTLRMGAGEIGETWNFEIRCLPDQPPTLWVKTKTIDYKYFETKPAINGYDIGIYDLAIKIEERLGASKQMIEELRNDFHNRKTARKNLILRLTKGLKGSYAIR